MEFLFRVLESREIYAQSETETPLSQEIFRYSIPDVTSANIQRTKYFIFWTRILNDHRDYFARYFLQLCIQVALVTFFQSI